MADESRKRSGGTRIYLVKGRTRKIHSVRCLFVMSHKEKRSTDYPNSELNSSNKQSLKESFLVTLSSYETRSDLN